MVSDPLDEIMGYLGLGPISSPPAAHELVAIPSAGDVGPRAGDGDLLLAAAGSATLWLVDGDGSEWIELRGQFPTVRATRPKAKLLMDVRQDLERWADGEKPDVRARDLTIRSVRRFGSLVLEVSYRTWKPVRLTRDQAKALLSLSDHVKSYVRS